MNVDVYVMLGERWDSVPESVAVLDCERVDVFMKKLGELVLLADAIVLLCDVLLLVVRVNDADDDKGDAEAEGKSVSERVVLRDAVG